MASVRNIVTEVTRADGTFGRAHARSGVRGSLASLVPGRGTKTEPHAGDVDRTITFASPRTRSSLRWTCRSSAQRHRSACVEVAS